MKTNKIPNFGKFWKVILHQTVSDTFASFRRQVTSTRKRTANDKNGRKTRENDVWQIEVTYLTKLALKKYSLKHELKSHPNDSKVWLDQSDYVWGYCCGCQSIKVSTFEALKNLKEIWIKPWIRIPLNSCLWWFSNSVYKSNKVYKRSILVGLIDNRPFLIASSPKGS